MADRLELQLGFTWESPSPAQVAAISGCSDLRQGAPGKIQVGADLGLHQGGKHRACAPIGQLQTTSEHHHLVPAELTLHGGCRFCGEWSQPVLVADWPG